jgi:hypothetical protein
MTAPLVFLDTETTGLMFDAEIWEFAGIRRDPDGTETELHLFIEHDEDKCRDLPESFLTDHLARFPGHSQAESKRGAAHRIFDFLCSDGEPVHVVGAVPNFDTDRISRLLRAEIGAHVRDPWHYHLIDVENLAVGYLAAMPPRLIPGASDAPALPDLTQRVVCISEPATIEHRTIHPPWDSDELSRAIGVEPPTTERHTAKGDARWARDIYDRVMGTNR